MALPLIPILLGAAAVGTGGWGLFKGGKAIADNSEADDINAQARRLQKRIMDDLNNAREKSRYALEQLGKKKIHVCDTSVGKFLTLFSMIKNIDLKESKGLNELGKLKIDKQFITDLKEISILAASFANGTAAGAIAGGAVAFGAYGAVGTFATASTGAAISGLSGVAATNATLAFLGGGSLAAGGLGMAGGMAVLGGIVAGPALLVLGSVMGAKASENLDNARSNLAKVQEAEAEVNVMITACNGIARRANMFVRTLARLEIQAIPMINGLSQIIKNEGTDYTQYSSASQGSIATLLATMVAVKAMLDTPLLDASGALTKKSQQVIEDVRGMLPPRRTEAS